MAHESLQVYGAHLKKTAPVIYRANIKRDFTAAGIGRILRDKSGKKRDNNAKIGADW
jgi:hypothetical protein